MRKILLLFITTFILSSLQYVNAQNYIEVDNGFELTTHKGCRLINDDLLFKLGSYITYNGAVEIEAQYGFKRRNISNFRLGFNYLYQQGFIYAKIGLGYKKYHYYHNSFNDVKGCDFKIGIGTLIPICSTILINISIDATNLVNGDYSSLKNTLIQPLIGLRFEF